MKKTAVILAILLIGFYSCKQEKETIKLKNNTVTFNGQIENFKGVYNTGKLTYFDGVSRIFEDRVFKIDSLGHFKFDINIVHPLLAAYFDLEGKYYGNFLIEPNTVYQVTVKNGTMEFNGETGEKTRQIRAFYNILHKKLGDKIKKEQQLHTKGLSIKVYIQFQKQLETEKLNVLKAYAEEQKLNKQVYIILESEIKLKTAHAVINYRYDYSKGFPIPRKTLPKDFYSNLYKNYPVKKIEDLASRNGIDYVANIYSILEKQGQTIKEQLQYIKNSNLLTKEEFEIMKQLLSGDRTAAIGRYNKLMKNKRKILHRLNCKYNVERIIKNTNVITEPIFKDVIIAQSIFNNYFKDLIQPSKEVWKQIENAITNTSILQYLKEKLSNKEFALQKSKKEENHAIAEKLNRKILKTVKKKYIDKYKGKVIYVDFYSTWCGPCRKEIPFAKQLHAKFKGKDIVFLNLCAKSKKQDWEKQIKQHNIQGENYLLSNREYDVLADYYKAYGFPAYILINQNGKVVEYNTLRPSSKKNLYNKLNKLLKKNRQ